MAKNARNNKKTMVGENPEKGNSATAEPRTRVY